MGSLGGSGEVEKEGEERRGEMRPVVIVGEVGRRVGEGRVRSSYILNCLAFSYK